MGFRRGQVWEEAGGGPADLEVTGSDADLGRALAGARPGVVVRFHPSADSDLARAVGLRAGASPGGGVLPLDALRLRGGGLAVNGVVAGVAPDRLKPWHRMSRVEVEVDGRVERLDATSVVVMNGQYWRGADVSPRGHPGDGMAEIQIYSVRPGQRRAMRSRLASGGHLPHPQITTRRGRRVTVRFDRPVRPDVDGSGPFPRSVSALELEVVPAAYRLLI